MKKGRITWMEPVDLRQEIETAHANPPHAGLHIQYFDDGFYVIDGRRANEDRSAEMFGPHKTMAKAKLAAERGWGRTG